MKPLSPRATELLAALEVAPSVRARLRGAEDERVHILARLAETPEPAVVPHLLPLLIEGPVAVARAAAHVVSRVVALTASADLLQMDAAWRRAGWYASP